MGTRRWLLGAVAVVLVVAGCGTQVAMPSGPPATPYEGPLYVEVTAPPDATGRAATGAAGRVVDCDSAVVGGQNGSPFEGEVTRTARRAVTHDGASSVGVTSGFRQLRDDGDRVLFGYVVDGRVKQAVIVRDGVSIDHHRGWYVESYARCDLAEFPPSVAASYGLRIWHDRSGDRVATTRIVSAPGPGHCDWQDMTFLDLHGGQLDGGRTYLGNADPEYVPDYFAGPYRPDVSRPDDATDTGFRLDGRTLWLSADRRYAYVQRSVGSARFEAWPAIVHPFACA